jgi:hypothetical protein
MLREEEWSRTVPKIKKFGTKERRISASRSEKPMNFYNIEPEVAGG